MNNEYASLFESIILSIIDVSCNDVGRYRGCYLDTCGGKNVIAVRTRNGAGNRECWNDAGQCDPDQFCPACIMIYVVPNHPNYLRDVDDSFDPTYAIIYYNIPEGFEKIIDSLSDFCDTEDNLTQKLETLLKNIDTLDGNNEKFAKFKQKFKRPPEQKMA